MYFLAYWWKRDRDTTNFIVTVVDITKYFFSLIKHIFSVWVLVELCLD